MPARSRSGARSPTKGDADAAFNLGQAYRLGKGVPLDLARRRLVRARGAQGPCRRPDHARPAAVPERQPHRRDALAEGGRRARRAARAADLRHRACINGDGVPQPTRCSAMPMSAAPPRRAGAGQGDAGRHGRGHAARAAAEGRRRWPRQMPAPKSPPRRPRAQRSSAASGQSRRRPKAAAPAQAAQSAPPTRRSRRPIRARAASGGSSSAPSASAARPKRCSQAVARQARRRQAIMFPVGAVTRLQVGPFESRAAAAAACAARAQPCFPVEAR
jgi:hypothetical protein